MRKRDIFVIFIFLISIILGIIYRKPGVPKALKLYVEYVREKQDRKEPIVLNYKIDFSRWKLSLYSDNEELLYEDDYFQKAYFPYPEVKEIKYTITENEDEITIAFEFYKEDLILYIKGFKKYKKNSKFDIIKEISNSNRPNILPFHMEINIHKKAGELNEFILNQPKTINGLKLNEISMSEYDIEGNIIKNLNFKNEEIIVLPRKEEYGEHVNNHQEEIAYEMEKKGLLKKVDTYEQLKNSVIEIIKNNEGKIKKNYISNNEKFNDMLINYLKNI